MGEGDPRSVEWQRLDTFAQGGWTGALDTDTAVSFMIACTPDPAGYFDAEGRAERFLDDVTQVASVPVGERSEAVRLLGDSPVVGLRWYRGPAYGLVVSGADEDWAKVEAFALALDELLTAALG